MKDPERICLVMSIPDLALQELFFDSRYVLPVDRNDLGAGPDSAVGGAVFRNVKSVSVKDNRKRKEPAPGAVIAHRLLTCKEHGVSVAYLRIQQHDHAQEFLFRQGVCDGVI